MSVVILYLVVLVSGIFSIFRPAANEFAWSVTPDRDRLWPNWEVEHGSVTVWP